jgi:hypothetical protein
VIQCLSGVYTLTHCSFLLRITTHDRYQLGNKGNDLFEELIQLVSHYMSTSFMNDDFGYPLMLRAAKRQEMAAASYAPPAQQ